MDGICNHSYCSIASSMQETERRDLFGMLPNSFLEKHFINRTNESLQDFFNYEKPEGYGDSFAIVRIIISLVYSVVCALGLVGNLLVLYLMKIKQGWKKSPINLFVTILAVTDFQFVLTLPFWAVENALDFAWLFGDTMCKIVSYVTAMNMYASVFFLTAMSVARYYSVASALKSKRRPIGCSAKWVSALVWVSAVLASLPSAVFSTASTVSNEVLCLVKFPFDNEKAQFWLGLYHTQKVLLGFLIPVVIITICYLMLIRFISDKNVCTSTTKRRSKVTKSVTIVVLSFFVCWLPNQALTAWGILIKLNVVHFSYEFYTSQAYFFPVSVCLAHSNSCLNPILYCLMRREFRKALKNLFWRITSPSLTNMRPFTATTKPEQDEQAHCMVPLNAAEPDVNYYPPGAVIYNSRYDLLPSSSTEQRY
ncbi:relaxin-3 receptor 1 [Microcaecilia unicolor]|uniref:Relaxin-3 receptor 1 n=1 Tax=Microcaecilia unicolor TaxID=1415580 RepID=A0A6P7XCU3_9AMPH|nr:relaxin-3 receptor 1 [Microcaecilia unicolor]